MTEPRSTPTLRLWIGTSRQAGLTALLPPGEARDITLVPSSLDRRDPVLAEVRTALRETGSRSRVVVPSNPLGSLASLARRDAWTDVSRLDGDSVRLPTPLADAAHLWSVTDVRAVSGRGPYVLDLMARFVTPAERLRLLGSTNKADAVEVNLARRPSHCLLAWQLGSDHLVMATTDLIAAELVALALVDEDLGERHRLAGPWEDDLVQRATELDLGVRLPQEFTVATESAIPEAMHGVISRVFGRIGVTM